MTKAFTTEELMSKVKSLSSKYRGNSSHEDIQQEALLAYYEAVADGVTKEGTLITIMRKAMYHSIKTQDKPTRIPKGGNVYRLTKTLSREEYDKLGKTQKRIYEALQESSVDFEELSDMLSTKEIPIEDTIAVRQAFSEVLSLQEQAVVVGLILEDKTTRELALLLDISHGWVHEVRKTALSKLKEALDG